MTRILGIVLPALGGFGGGLDDGEARAERDAVPSLSYRGHENETDANNFVAVNPGRVGTRLDDCQTCHASGQVTYGNGRAEALNPCSYCHRIPHPDASIAAGYTNGAELLQGRYPGDAASMPDQRSALAVVMTW